MHDFEKFYYQEIRFVLASVDIRDSPDIYALSFFVSDVDEDPRYSVLQLGYNTLTRVAECTPSAADAEEARWNFTFWFQNELALVGQPRTKGRELLEDGLKEKSLWYSDEEEDIASACPSRATSPHTLPMPAFGSPRRSKTTGSSAVCLPSDPIVVHGLESYDEIALQTRVANSYGGQQNSKNRLRFCTSWRCYGKNLEKIDSLH